MSVRIYRVQDADGRGPFKPGFSHRWLDPSPSARDLLPPWIDEFGLGIISRINAGEHAGCGCRSINGLRRWFDDGELERLREFGYQVVMMKADRILAESVNQTVFVRSRPLKDGVLIIRMDGSDVLRESERHPSAALKEQTP